MCDAARLHTDMKRIVAFRELMLEAEAARLQPVAKLRLALFTLTGAAPDRGSLPIQEFEALVALRNLFIHVKPVAVLNLPGESAGTKCERPPAPVRHLANRKVIIIPKKNPYSWPLLAATPAVASWAHDTAVDTRRLLVQSISRRSQFRKVMMLHIRGERAIGPSA